jgi:DNA replication and repair protein RecF
MWLEKLHLINFKSYEDNLFSFGSRVNCFVGPNGSGKTNLLDAIYTLSLTKSAFHSQDALAIRNDDIFFLLDGTFQDSQRRTQITCSVQRGHRKTFMADKKAYEKLSDHIGQFPLVLIAPDDTDLVRDGSEARRKFFDGVLSQSDAEYLRNLLQYNKILSQRNALLKIFSEKNYIDHDLLETYDQPLLKIMNLLYTRKVAFLNQYIPLFRKHYNFLCSNQEEVDITYKSHLMDPEFTIEFKKNRTQDLYAQRTGKGIHKDEFNFSIDGISLKKFGSQGQIKSFVVALKLAQFELMRLAQAKTPILLLDDIFDKLDEFRIQKLLDLIDTGLLGQVFITDARKERSMGILAHLKAEVTYFEIKKNSVAEV